jgi:Protein of unknown function (DUF2934)
VISELRESIYGIETKEMTLNRVARTKSGNHAAPNDDHEKPDSANLAEASLDDEIRQRAYAIHIDRGGNHGYDLDDWLRAERELKQEKRVIPDGEDSAG